MNKYEYQLIRDMHESIKRMSVEYVRKENAIRELENRTVTKNTIFYIIDRYINERQDLLESYDDDDSRDSEKIQLKEEIELIEKIRNDLLEDY